MCTLQARMQCYDRFFEVFSNEAEHNELILENVISQMLIEYFDEVMVDVKIIFSPHVQMGMQHCLIQIHAQCESKTGISLPDGYKNIDLIVENKMCSILRELFGSVIVDCVTFIPSTRAYEYAHSSAG